MRVSRITFALIITMISFHAIYSMAQSTTPTLMAGSRAPLKSIDILKEKGIDPTHTSLTAALHNNDPLIRTSAATVLVQNKDPDAAPLIEAALASESNPKTIVELASILMSFGDAVGKDRLTKICTDPSVPSQTVSYAAFHLAVRQSGAQCIDELVRRLKDPSLLNSGMQLIPSLSPLYAVASQAQKDEILTALQSHLADKEPTTRMVASRALALTALPDSADKIRTALQHETDPMVRTGMESDLILLAPKPNKH